MAPEGNAESATTIILSARALAEAKRLLAFDYEGALYHVIAFDFEAQDGGAIGVVREGDTVCVRLSLDALAQLNRSTVEPTKP